MKNKRRILHHMLFAVAIVAAIFVSGGVTDASYAATDDMSDGVYFEQPYAEAGSDLTVKYDGSESVLTYKWYVDDKQVAAAADSSFKVTGDHYQKDITAEVWSGTSKLGEASMFCSKLPVLYIDTEGGQDVVTKDDYLNAQMHLQGNDQYASEKVLYTGATEIKGRGNSTWEYFPKKPYKLKLDKKTDLFGLGKNKHWVLLANYIDESGMRNMLAGELATRMGVGAMDGTWVELVLNGKNLGMYQLCEHVRLSEDRVDVFDWESAAEDIAEAIAEANGFSDDDMDALTDQMAEEDMSWISAGEVTYNGKTYKTADYYEDLPESFSGGYLLEMDFGYDEVSKFTTTNGAPLMFKSPEFINTDPVAMKTVTEYVQTFEDALYSKDFNTKSGDRMVSYTDLCDTGSMASFWLASEMFMNEIGCKSTYFQKDIDQVLKFGPVWDFDFSSGSVSPFSAQNPTDWTSDNKYWGETTEKWWFNKAMQDPYFAVKARNAYMEQEEYLNDVIAEGGVLDQWCDYLQESGRYNYELWQYANGFDSDYKELKAWLTKRINWMDKQFATNSSAMKSLGISFSDKFHLQLQGDAVESTGTAAYTVPADRDSVVLTVAVDSGEYSGFNYYINSKYQGESDLENGKADIVIRTDQLTEAAGDDNVITVWLRDADGALTEQQYLTVKLTSDTTLFNVVFNDMGGSHAEKAVSGQRLYLDYPLNQEADHVFEGWSDGSKVYKAGEWLTVSGDVTLNAVWAVCSDGGYSHELKADGETMVCAAEGCSASKASGVEYVDLRACMLTVSNRLSNYYSGKEIKPRITLTYAGKDLVQGKDYTVEYTKNINAGYARYTVKSISGSGYKGEYTLTYRILPADISKVTVDIPARCELNNGIAEPVVKLTYNGKTLVNGTDYELVFSNNTAPGTASAVITGKGNFSGSVTKTFKVIEPLKDISKCVVTGVPERKAYTGKAVKPAVTVKNGGVKLTAGTHYKVKYSNNIKCGTAVVTITGVENNGYKGSKTLKFKIRPAKAQAKVVNVKYNQQKVTWNKVTGATKYNVYRSVDNKNYKLVKSVKQGANRVYSSKNLKAGKTYYYKVRAVRAQKSGSSTVNYLGIEAAPVKLKTVLHYGVIKSAENTPAGAATIKWAGVNGANGYKVYRSTTNKAGSFKVIKTVRFKKTFTDENLKKGKTYYYKVRAYRKVDGKMVYGALSKSSAVKIKK